MDIDACIESIKKCKYLPESDMRKLCNKVIKKERGEKIDVLNINNLQVERDSCRRIYCSSSSCTSDFMW